MFTVVGNEYRYYTVNTYVMNVLFNRSRKSHLIERNKQNHKYFFRPCQ
jgi:hypothetical protein